MSRIKKIIELTKELNENCKHLETPEEEQPTNWENEYPLNTFKGEAKNELIQFVTKQIDKTKAEVKKSNIDYLKKLCWSEKDISYFLKQYKK